MLPLIFTFAGRDFRGETVGRGGRRAFGWRRRAARGDRSKGAALAKLQQRSIATQHEGIRDGRRRGFVRGVGGPTGGDERRLKIRLNEHFVNGIAIVRGAESGHDARFEFGGVWLDVAGIRYETCFGLRPQRW